MFENKQSVSKNSKRKVSLLSEALSLFREKKVFYIEILAPGTIKENTIDCHFLIGLLTGERIEPCYKEDRTWVQHCLFYLNPAGKVNRIMTFSLFRRVLQVLVDKPEYFELEGDTNQCLSKFAEPVTSRLSEQSEKLA